MTANRKLVKAGGYRLPRYVRAKGAISRYSDVNCTRRNHYFNRRVRKLFKVYGFDYSYQNSISKFGKLRYRVAGGYITGNIKYIKVVR